MTVHAAVTIRRTRAEIESAWSESGGAPFGDDAKISYAPAPGDRGTEVRVTLGPGTGNGIGEKLAAVVGTDTRRRLEDALRRFKQILETGEVLRSDASPEGTDARHQRAQQAAQPRPKPTANANRTRSD
jgi:uncharacterized membrane protein